jgi:hypothetical protein
MARVLAAQFGFGIEGILAGIESKDASLFWINGL